MHSKYLWNCLLLILTVSSSVYSDVTYSLHLGGVDSSIAATITNSTQEAVAIYNKYGSFNKHLNIYYNSGVPTAQASYNGTITFGGSKNTRVAMHETAHTFGMGTTSAYANLISTRVWTGLYGNLAQFQTYNSYTDGLHGDGHAIWPGGFNYDDEDGSIQRIWHTRIMAAIRADMGIMSYIKEAEHQIVPLGGTAVFSLASPLAGSYQWYKDGSPLSNGTDISGANRSTLQIANVDAADAGNYYCIASGAGEDLNSRPRRLFIKGQTGRWNFDNNTNDSIGSFDAAAFGSPSYTTGIVGNAIDLDGSNDYVTLPNGIADADDITIATWVYWDGGNNWQRLFDFGASTANYMFLTPKTGSVMRFAIKNGGDEQRVETSQLPTGQWVHLAVTLRNDAATIYVNGKAVASNGSVTINPAELLADHNYIGDSQFNADPPFNGRIDDFRIFNYSLSGSQIWKLWGQSSNNPPTFNPGPITIPYANVNTAYSGQTLANFASDPDGSTITFSKVSGPTWLTVASNGSLSGMPGSSDGGNNSFVVRTTDPSGASDDIELNITVNEPTYTYYKFDSSTSDNTGSNHGTATGNPTYSAGILGQAIELDGDDDYVTLPADVINHENFTIASWVYWDGGGNWQRIFDFGNNTTQYMFLSPNASGSALIFAITGSGGGSQEQRLETNGLPIGQWTHIAVTINGNTGKLYVNGELKDINAAMTINPTDFYPTVNYIGKSQWPDPLFNGKIDDFRIFDYALTPSQITLLALPPSFTADSIINSDAIELQPYSGQSLAEFVEITQEAGELTFSKDSGPGWLNVETDGTLSGTPGDYHVGNNTFTVRVTNQTGFDTAQISILVANVFSGVRGPEDLSGLAAQWLASECTDTPACSGADLNGDFNVNIADFAAQAQNWLADESLLLYLKFDTQDNNYIIDNSIFNRSCLPFNGPTKSSAGYLNSGITFDGIDDYIMIDSFPGIGESNARTITAWINADEDLANAEKNIHSIASWGKAEAAKKWLFMLDSQTGQLALATYAGRLIGGPDLEDGIWHHVAIVLPEDTNNINQVKLFVDGAEIATNADSLNAQINSALTENLIIGAIDTNPANNIQTPVFPFKGMIDEFRLYNTEISKLANTQ